MGASFDYRVYEVKDFDKARKQFSRDIEESRYMNGREYSGCIGMKEGAQRVNKTFETKQEALNYIEEHNDKWEDATAVMFKAGGKMTKASENKQKKLNEAVGTARHNIEELRHKFELEIKQAKSKFRACKNCQSKINRAYIRGASCPLCSHTLFSPTQEKRLWALEKKKQEAESKREKFTPKYTGGKKEHWIIGGWCSS